MIDFNVFCISGATFGLIFNIDGSLVVGWCLGTGTRIASGSFFPISRDVSGFVIPFLIYNEKINQRQKLGRDVIITNLGGFAKT